MWDEIQGEAGVAENWVAVPSINSFSGMQGATMGTTEITSSLLCMFFPLTQCLNLTSDLSKHTQSFVSISILFPNYWKFMRAQSYLLVPMQLPFSPEVRKEMVLYLEETSLTAPPLQDAPHACKHGCIRKLDRIGP